VKVRFDPGKAFEVAAHDKLRGLRPWRVANVLKRVLNVPSWLCQRWNRQVCPDTVRRASDSPAPVVVPRAPMLRLPRRSVRRSA